MKIYTRYSLPKLKQAFQIQYEHYHSTVGEFKNQNSIIYLYQVLYFKNLLTKGIFAKLQTYGLVKVLANALSNHIKIKRHAAGLRDDKQTCYYVWVRNAVCHIFNRIVNLIQLQKIKRLSLKILQFWTRAKLTFTKYISRMKHRGAHSKLFSKKLRKLQHIFKCLHGKISGQELSPTQFNILIFFYLTAKDIRRANNKQTTSFSNPVNIRKYAKTSKLYIRKLLQSHIIQNKGTSAPRKLKISPPMQKTFSAEAAVSTYPKSPKEAKPAGAPFTQMLMDTLSKSLKASEERLRLQNNSEKPLSHAFDLVAVNPISSKHVSKNLKPVRARVQGSAISDVISTSYPVYGRGILHKEPPTRKFSTTTSKPVPAQIVNKRDLDYNGRLKTINPDFKPKQNYKSRQDYNKQKYGDSHYNQPFKALNPDFKPKQNYESREDYNKQKYGDSHYNQPVKAINPDFKAKQSYKSRQDYYTQKYGDPRYNPKSRARISKFVPPKDNNKSIPKDLNQKYQYLKDNENFKPDLFQGRASAEDFTMLSENFNKTSFLNAPMPSQIANKQDLDYNGRLKTINPDFKPKQNYKSRQDYNKQKYGDSHYNQPFKALNPLFQPKQNYESREDYNNQKYGHPYDPNPKYQYLKDNENLKPELFQGQPSAQGVVMLSEDFNKSSSINVPMPVQIVNKRDLDANGRLMIINPNFKPKQSYKSKKDYFNQKYGDPKLQANSRDFTPQNSYNNAEEHNNKKHEKPNYNSELEVVRSPWAIDESEYHAILRYYLTFMSPQSYYFRRVKYYYEIYGEVIRPNFKSQTGDKSEENSNDQKYRKSTYNLQLRPVSPSFKPQISYKSKQDYYNHKYGKIEDNLKVASPSFKPQTTSKSILGYYNKNSLLNCITDQDLKKLQSLQYSNQYFTYHMKPEYMNDSRILTYPAPLKRRYATPINIARYLQQGYLSCRWPVYWRTLLTYFRDTYARLDGPARQKVSRMHYKFRHRTLWDTCFAFDYMEHKDLFIDLFSSEYSHVQRLPAFKLRKFKYLKRKDVRVLKLYNQGKIKKWSNFHRIGFYLAVLKYHMRLFRYSLIRKNFFATKAVHIARHAVPISYFLHLLTDKLRNFLFVNRILSNKVKSLKLFLFANVRKLSRNYMVQDNTGCWGVELRRSTAFTWQVAKRAQEPFMRPIMQYVDQLYKRFVKKRKSIKFLRFARLIKKRYINIFYRQKIFRRLKRRYIRDVYRPFNTSRPYSYFLLRLFYYLRLRRVVRKYNFKKRPVRRLAQRFLRRYKVLAGPHNYLFCDYYSKYARMRYLTASHTEKYAVQAQLINIIPQALNRFEYEEQRTDYRSRQYYNKFWPNTMKASLGLALWSEFLFSNFNKHLNYSPALIYKSDCERADIKKYKLLFRQYLILVKKYFQAIYAFKYAKNVPPHGILKRMRQFEKLRGFKKIPHISIEDSIWSKHVKFFDWLKFVRDKKSFFKMKIVLDRIFKWIYDNKKIKYLFGTHFHKIILSNYLLKNIFMYKKKWKVRLV